MASRSRRCSSRTGQVTSVSPGIPAVHVVVASVASRGNGAGLIPLSEPLLFPPVSVARLMTPGSSRGALMRRKENGVLSFSCPAAGPQTPSLIRSLQHHRPLCHRHSVFQPFVLHNMSSKYLQSVPSHEGVASPTSGQMTRVTAATLRRPSVYRIYCQANGRGWRAPWG